MTRKFLLAMLCFVAMLGLAHCCYALPRLFGEAPLAQIVSGPFLFTTDVPAAEVERLSAELLTLERRITAELKLPRLATPVRIYLFQNKNRYLRYVEQYFPSMRDSAKERRAFFRLRERVPYIVLHGSPQLRQDLRHEFTHALLDTSVRKLPMWLDEGLAVYFEVPDGSGFQKRYADVVRARIHQGSVIGPFQLENLTDHQQMRELQYSVSWSWAHFLITGPDEIRNVLIDYLADLRNEAVTESVLIRLACRLDDPYQSWQQHVEKLDSWRR